MRKINTEQVLLSETQVIGRIIQLLEAFPSVGVNLPANKGTTAYWTGLFAKNERTRRLMELYRELPLLTRMTKRVPTRMDWLEVLQQDFVILEDLFTEGRRVAIPVKKASDVPQDFCPTQVKEVVRRVLACAMNLAASPQTKYWRDQFGPQEVIQRVRPEESDAYIPNPHRGTTTFQRFQGDAPYTTWLWSDAEGPTKFEPEAPVKDNVQFVPRTTLSYCRWPWRWFEPQKGKYNWTVLDQALKTAKARGQTLQIRFQPFTRALDYRQESIPAKRHPPEVSVDMPDWYWDTGAGWIEKGPYHKNEPDCNDPKYIRHFGNFIRAAAKRYDGHPDLESVDIAVAGKWGESGGNATPETKGKLISVFRRSFKKTQLIAMLGVRQRLQPDDPDGREGLPAGFRADCFGDLRKRYGMGVPPALCWNQSFDVYPKVISHPGMVDAWNTAPVIMESCGTVASWFIDGYDIDVVIREGYKYHTSVFMPKSVFYPAAWRDKLLEFDKKIGYRFVIRQITMPLECKPGQAISVQWFMDNIGCAPIYRPYRLALRFRQGKTHRMVLLKTDIRDWMPGHTWFEEPVLVPQGLKPGEVNMDMVIVDEAGRPKVWFAMDAKTDDGWHPLTSLDVV